MRDAERIAELRSSRGTPTGFLANFLCSFSEAARLMHKVLETFRADSGLIAQAERAYIISIASCLETFYRDLLVYALARDEVSLSSVLQGIREKATAAEFHRLLRDGVSFPEIASSGVTFQSLAEIEAVMAYLFQPTGYLAALDSYHCDCLIPSRGGRARFNLDKEWRADVERIFRERHALVHDANRKMTVVPHDLARLETVALLVPQLTTELLAKRHAGKGTLRVEGEPSLAELPVLLLVKDVISDEWEITDDVGIKTQW